MIEFARYSCPRCGAVYDVWLEAGEPQDDPWCPECEHDGITVPGLPDEEESSLWAQT